MKFEPNIDEAKQFLHALDPTADEFTFQIFWDRKDGSKPPKNRPATLVRSGSLNNEDDVKYLRSANIIGYGVYVTVNETDLQGRTLKNIKAIRAVFQEDDSGFGTNSLPLQPNIVVESSPGNFHSYFCVNPDPTS